jgi:uncharacterized membrane protein
MNRTYKRFFKKIGVGLLSVLKFLGILLAASIPSLGVAFLITGDHVASLFFAVICTMSGFTAWLFLKDVWDDSKKEVERENRDMMRVLAGKDR